MEAGRSGEHRLQVTLPSDATAGVYLIHVWTGDLQRPTALGKAAVVVGPIVAGFCLPISIVRIR